MHVTWIQIHSEREKNVELKEIENVQFDEERNINLANVMERNVKFGEGRHFNSSKAETGESGGKVTVAIKSLTPLSRNLDFAMR